jgi:TRAP-type C4-dicarboxylate transport system permease small subunit
MDGPNADSLDASRRDVELAKLRSVATFALSALRRIVDLVAMTLLFVMVFLILAQILGRYVFNYSISWTEEIATFAQIWLVMLGAGIAMRNRQHVGIDFLVTRCSFAVQRIVKGIGFLLGSWFLLVVISGSFGLLAIGLLVKSPALQIPLAIPYSALLVGMSYFLLEFAIATLPEIRDPACAPASKGGEIE